MYTQSVCARACICVGVQFIHAYNVSQRRRHAVMLVVAAAMQADVPKYINARRGVINIFLETIFHNIWREKLKACLGKHRFCPWLCLARTPSRCMTTSAYLSAHISTFNGVTMANCYDNFNKLFFSDENTQPNDSNYNIYLAPLGQLLSVVPRDWLYVCTSFAIDQRGRATHTLSCGTTST